MGKLRVSMPSPAMIVAIAALVMASIGTTVAAIQLPRNSVATKHLKRNAVTGAKVKRRTLTGADINLNKLGVVPNAAQATNAAHAASADTASFAIRIAAPEPVHLVGAAGEPPFAPGASNLGILSGPGVAVPPVSFYKDREGIVHLEGVAKIEGGGEGVIFVLPPGYRPAGGTVQVVGIDQLGDVLIFGSNVISKGQDLSGAVVAVTGTGALLSGITYRAGS